MLRQKLLLQRLGSTAQNIFAIPKTKCIEAKTLSLALPPAEMVWRIPERKKRQPTSDTGRADGPERGQQDNLSPGTAPNQHGNGQANHCGHIKTDTETGRPYADLRQKLSGEDVPQDLQRQPRNKAHKQRGQETRPQPPAHCSQDRDISSPPPKLLQKLQIGQQQDRRQKYRRKPYGDDAPVNSVGLDHRLKPPLPARLSAPQGEARSGLSISKARD